MRFGLGPKSGAWVVAASLLLNPGGGNAAVVKTANAACQAVKTQVSAARHFPVSAIAFCDIIREQDSPKAYYVLALHSTRQCEGICSTHMGWFAVQKSTGRVFEWDEAEEKLGASVKARR